MTNFSEKNREEPIIKLTTTDAIHSSTATYIYMISPDDIGQRHPLSLGLAKLGNTPAKSSLRWIARSLDISFHSRDGVRADKSDCGRRCNPVAAARRLSPQYSRASGGGASVKPLLTILEIKDEPRRESFYCVYLQMRQYKGYLKSTRV